METINTLLEKLQATGMNEDVQEALDELVHDISESDASQNNPFCPDAETDEYEDFQNKASLAATNINNEGQEAQLRYLSESGANTQVFEALQELVSSIHEAR